MMDSGRLMQCEITGIDFGIIMTLWNNCYEFNWTTERIGNWHRIEWPEPGGMLEQHQLIIDIFNEILKIKREAFFQGIR